MGSSRHAGGPPLLGFILLAVGAVLLLGNLGIWDLDLGDLIRRFWPLLFIFLGVRHLLDRRILSGGVLLALGVIFELRAFDLIDGSTIRRWWPLLLIAVGGWLVFRTFRPSPDPPVRDGSRVVDPQDTFRIFQMWGGTSRVITSQAFSGGEATAFMGGVEVDLRPSKPAGGTARIDVTALMGGVELKVPEDWDVDVTGSPFLGAIVDSRGTRKAVEGEGPRPKLEIRATVLMGGLEIG